MSVQTSEWSEQEIAGGRYRILARLGEGGMGFVYRGYDANLDTEVVIKVPRRTMLEVEGFRERFTREIRSLVRLQHPHVVKLLDVGEQDGLPFAVMQLLTGGDLNARRPKKEDGTREPVPPQDVCRWLPGVSEALDFIHTQGYIHRDVKPANILFDSHDNVFLSDFGVAKVVAENVRTEEKLTGTGLVLGTPEYMSPELIMGHPCDGRVDQYALAVTVYETLCGRCPFLGSTPAAILVAHTTQPAPPLSALFPSIPQPVSDAVLRGLAKRPEDRYPNCATFSQAVVAAIEGRPFFVEPAPSQASVDTSLDLAQTAGNMIPLVTSPVSPRRRSGEALLKGFVAVAESFALGVVLLAFCCGLLAVGYATVRSVRDLSELVGALDSWVPWTLISVGVLLAGGTLRQGAPLVLGRSVATPDSSSRRMKLRERVALGILASMIVLGLEVAVLDSISVPTEATEPDKPTAEERVESVPVVEHAAASDFTNSLGMSMIALRPGRFVGVSGEPAMLESPLWVSTREVSVAQYLTFLETRAQKSPALASDNLPNWAKGTIPAGIEPELLQKNGTPIVGITRQDAEAFCQWLTEREPQMKYRLPTRDEWVAACRGGTSTKFFWGDTFVRSMGNSDGIEDGYLSIAPVGRFPAAGKPPHPWGLNDLAGNVWEMIAPDRVSSAGPRQPVDACGGGWDEKLPENFSVSSLKTFSEPSGNLGFRVVADHARTRKP